MPANRGPKNGYGESWIGAWVLIIAASGVVVALHLTGAAAVIIGAALVIGFAAATSRKR